MRKMIVKKNHLVAAIALVFAPLLNAAQVSMTSTGDWNSAFQGSTDITNNETEIVNGWTLEFAASFTIDQIWNAKIISRTGDTYVLGSLDHTSKIKPGEKINFGFIASPGNSMLPTMFSFNDENSGGGNPILTPTPTATPVPTATPSSTTTPNPTPTPVPTTTPSPTSTPLPNPDPGSALPGDDWLSISGNTIVNKEGKAVWLTGANWFGFNTQERIFHGIWSVNLDATIKAMADRGINLIRVPFATALIDEWMRDVFVPISFNEFANPELAGKTSLEIFDAFIESAKRHGMKVLLDAHSPHIDNSGHVYPTWAREEITEEVFYNTWVWLAERYKNDDTVIGFDLENEPHGKAHSDTNFAKWDNSADANNWKRVAEEASKRIMAVNPNLLILVEGIEVYPTDGVTWTSKNEDDYHFNWWGGNLRGVKDYPVTVPGHQNQIMYSPHDYGPLVFQQSWFYPGFNKDTLIADVWEENWLYIHRQEISPLLMGEWGGFLDGGDNEKWMLALRELMDEYKIHHTFWTLNPNSGDTGGLLAHDWTTWDEDKYNILEAVLWQNSQGKYIGLDHEVPLGANGITVSEHYANGGLEPLGL